MKNLNIRVPLPWQLWLFCTVALAAGFSFIIYASYLFAYIGEPRSVWIWRDILGVLP